MSEGIGRRDTLKLASAAAALGAGLGVVLEARDALAGDGSVMPAPPAQIQQKMLKIDAVQQIKIDGYQKLRAERGQMQIKLNTAAGQLLYAANVPDEIASLLFSAPGGQLQIKFWRAAGPNTALVPELFREGVMQLSPSVPASAPAAK